MKYIWILLMLVFLFHGTKFISHWLQKQSVDIVIDFESIAPLQKNPEIFESSVKDKLHQPTWKRTHPYQNNILSGTTISYHSIHDRHYY